ncbi:MAG: hypothetical protein HY884_05910 [Deltaproteobacteria bacterium]|nr:hypothetical protein [Deltaproteobacteria bacterium]
MTDVLDIGKFAKPAEVLIERISAAIGGVFEPWQIRRVAQAEAEAEKIKEISRIEIVEYVFGKWSGFGYVASKLSQ